MTKAIALAMALAAAGLAAECGIVTGDHIYASDLAALAPAFGAVPATAVFGYSPRPATRRGATAEELGRFARAHGISAEFDAMCFVRAAAPPDTEAAAAAMRASLGSPEARIEIVEISRFPAPPGVLVFPRESLVEPAAGGVAVWNGHVQYDGGRFAIWVKARIAVPVTRLVAASALRPGQILAEGDVRVETAEDFPRRTQPLSNPADAVGKAARRAIAAGAAIPANALIEPNAVERGDTVMVEVRSGGAVLKLEAKAEAPGRRGDTIPLRNAASGKLFRARIEDKGRVALECRGSETSR